MRKLIAILMIVGILLSSTLSFAATDFYQLGYEAGWNLGIENFGKDIKSSRALNDHKRTDEYELVMSEFTSAFDLIYYDEGFIAGYEDAMSGTPIKVNFADVLGKSLGSIYGARDYQDGVKPNWEKALPNDRTLRRMFNLDLDSSEYREAFLSEFKIAFSEAYMTAYENAKFDSIRISLQQGVKDGEDLGKLLGASFGKKDYYENKDLDFTRNMPSDRDIIAEYSLNGDTEEYKDGFLSGFKRAYEAEYNKAYREANINETLRDEKDAYNHGKEVGKIQGEIVAISDYLQHKLNDWKRSVPDEEKIIEDFNLKIQSPNYRDSFIAGFYDGYSEGYNTKFKEFSQGSAVGKSTSEVIPLAGGTLASQDNAMGIAIESGTYYNPVYLTINTLYNPPIAIKSSMIKASDSYVVNLLNTSGNVDDKKDVTLAFEYYGDKIKGGIYKLIGGQWLYLPSVIDEGVISTQIKPSHINGTYSVFVDTNAFLFPDSRGHWANEEINTFVRRNIIYGYSDNTFKPDRSISRAEFLTILSRTYNWRTEFANYGNILRFTDYELFGARSNIINYATAFGYISGYPDGTFRPNDPISYSEVEIIMKRVLSDINFKWSDIATKILHEKKARSTSFDSMDNKITRAEVVYMLYELTQE